MRLRVYKGQWGHIDNHDPIELLGRERGKRMVWEATDVALARGATRRRRFLTQAAGALCATLGHPNMRCAHAATAGGGAISISGRNCRNGT